MWTDDDTYYLRQRSTHIILTSEAEKDVLS